MVKKYFFSPVLRLVDNDDDVTVAVEDVSLVFFVLCSLLLASVSSSSTSSRMSLRSKGSCLKQTKKNVAHYSSQTVCCMYCFDEL